MNLTDREKEVLEAVYETDCDRQRASEALSITKATLNFHLAQAMQKYHVNNLAALMVKIFKTGLIF